MLKRVSKSSAQASDATVAIVASKYNGRYVDAMVKAARRALGQAGAKIELVRVPGAFEIPTVTAAIASRAAPPAAIICLGVIFQGQTSHAQHIGWGVTHALADLQVTHRLPVIHGVFVFEKEEHARGRCLSRTHNRGTEAAHTALEMARVMKSLRT